MIGRSPDSPDLDGIEQVDPNMGMQSEEAFGDERDVQAKRVAEGGIRGTRGLPESMFGNVIQEAVAGIYPAELLARREYPPLRSYVDGLIVEGLAIIGGKPKLGKSWLALALAAAVARGGIALGNSARSVTQAPVLYLALEDGERRIKSRLERVCPDGIPEYLAIAHDWPYLGAGGIDALDAAIDADKFGLIIIDTLQRVRGPRQSRDVYGEDYRVLSELHDLARSRDGLALTLVHHNRKDDRPDDYVDALSGSTGIGGSADLVAVLTRGRGEADAVLSITGRDVNEDERALKFDAGVWTELGSAAEHAISKARRGVLKAVAEITATGRPARVSEVADCVGTSKQNASQMLHKLTNEGTLRNVDHGAFLLSNPVDMVDDLTLVPQGQLSQSSQPPPVVETTDRPSPSASVVTL